MSTFSGRCWIKRHLLVRNGTAEQRCSVAQTFHLRTGKCIFITEGGRTVPQLPGEKKGHGCRIYFC